MHCKGSNSAEHLWAIQKNRFIALKGSITLWPKLVGHCAIIIADKELVWHLPFHIFDSLLVGEEIHHVGTHELQPDD
jgi:hypothetical protein